MIAMMFTRLHKLAFASLAVVSLVGGSFSGYQKTAGKLQMATVVYNQDIGLYTDDFADATGIAANTQAGVDVATGMVKLQNAVGGYTAPYLTSGSVTLNILSPLRVAAYNTLDIVATTPPGTGIKAQILGSTGIIYRDALVPGNSTGFSSFPLDLTGVPFLSCPDVYVHDAPPPYNSGCIKVGAIAVRFLLETSDSNATPSIDSVSLDWITSRGGTASSLSDAPWSSTFGDMQGSYLSKYGSAAVYPAFRWVGTQQEGNWALSGVQNTLVLNNAMIYNTWNYAAGLVSTDTDDGSENWRLPFFGYVSGGIVTQNGIFYGTDSGNDLFYAIDTSTGQIKWTYNFVGGHGNGQVIINTDGSRIYTIRNNVSLINTIYIFGPDGTLLTTNAITAPAGIRANPTQMVVSPVDGTLYFGTSILGGGNASTDTGKLYALDPTSGIILWSYDTGDIYNSSELLVGSDGTIYVAKSFEDKDFPIQLLAINPGIAPAERVKWVRNFGTGDIGIRQIALRSDGNLWIKYHLNSNELVRMTAINSLDGTNLSTPLDTNDIWDPIVSLYGGGFLAHGSILDDPADSQEHLTAYDASLNLKWMINYSYDASLVDTFYLMSQPVVGGNGWIYSTLGKTVYVGPDQTPADEYVEPFALAPWTLAPQTSTSTVFRGDDISFTVVTSMQEENPLTAEANQMQIVLDTGVKVPLAYSSTNGDGDTVWTGTYTTPITMEARTHTFTVQANQPLVKTDITVAFDAPATGSDNTGLTAPGSFNVITRGGGSPAPAETPVGGNTNNQEPNSNQNNNENANTPPEADQSPADNTPLAALGMVIPGRPVVYIVSPTEVRLVIDPNGNTVPTRFWIQDSITGKYVQADGSLGDTPFVKTFLDWGGDDGVIMKVKPNTRYKFRVAARPGI